MSPNEVFKRPPYMPGHGPKPSLPTASHPISYENFASHEIFNLGLECHLRGYFWEAHEVLESLWHLQTGDLKILVQILIQRSAAALKLRQNDPEASKRLAESALAKLKSLSLKNCEMLGLSTKELNSELESIQQQTTI